MFLKNFPYLGVLKLQMDLAFSPPAKAIVQTKMHETRNNEKTTGYLAHSGSCEKKLNLIISAERKSATREKKFTITT